jgi:hypothetical protein
MIQRNERLAHNEHLWRIPMPWKRIAYAIHWDEERPGRPCLFIAWSLSPITGFHLRMGWSYLWGDQEAWL